MEIMEQSRENCFHGFHVCACVSYLFMCVCEEGERERDGVSKLSRVDVMLGSHSCSEV